MSLRVVLVIGLVSGNLIGLLGVLIALSIIRSSAPAAATTATATTAAVPKSVTAQPTLLLPVIMNEMLVYPVSPMIDMADEFIELFNPNAQSVEITGYVFKTASASTGYKFPATTLPPGGYVSVMSTVSDVSLVNAGGSLMLLDAAGATINQIAWAQSVSGASWALFNDGWHWTGTTTAAASNVLKLVGTEAAAAVQVAAAIPAPVATPTPTATPTPIATQVPAVVAATPAASSAVTVAAPVTPSAVVPVTAPAGVPGQGAVLAAETAAAAVPPIITELLPDPVAPDTDADAEFIELYNPGAEPFNLKGFTLKTVKP